jgi:hypothetical protein
MTEGTMIALAGVALAAVSAFGGAAIAAIGVSWRLRGWLGDQFSTTRQTFYDAMDSHEALDQKRHEDNLERFTAIRVMLASHGIENGHPRSSDRH